MNPMYKWAHFAHGVHHYHAEPGRTLQMRLIGGHWHAELYVDGWLKAGLVMPMPRQTPPRPSDEEASGLAQTLTRTVEVSCVS